MAEERDSGFDFNEHSHRRYNPLTGDWILVSPHRAKRPWQGQVEEVSSHPRLRYDPDCYLCPGNSRAGGIQNPDYQGVFVFENDFPALMSKVPQSSTRLDEVLISDSERGICRVVCFTPRHDLTLSEMDLASVKNVVQVWIEQISELSGFSWVNFVQIFENRGEMMGCSNPHPHCQIWATESVPNEVSKEDRCQSEFSDRTGGCLLCRYLKLELDRRERIVVENDEFVGLVPFWAIWPFETLVISRRHLPVINQLSENEQEAFADILLQLTIRYDNLFNTSFPYSMGLHEQPVHSESSKAWHFHAHFYPPLLRSATVRKFMVGFEMLASPQRDITAETAAKRLRELPGVHYRLAITDR